MNKTILYIFILMFVCACTHDDALEEELAPEHTVIISVPDKIMEEPDGVIDSRASFTMNPLMAKMSYSWDAGDQIGVFNVSLPAGPNNESTVFGYKSSEGTTARFFNSDFVADTEHFWVAYAPYKCHMSEDGGRSKILSYDEINLTYKGQKQLYNATPNGKNPNDDDSAYGPESEARACNQLADYDYIITTTPTHPSEAGEAMHLRFGHVGATVRCYMRLPEGCFGGETGRLTSLSIVCKENKLVTDVKLAINPYDIYQSNGNQTYSEKETPTTSNILTLDLPGPQGNGIELPDHGYFISYMEFYPTEVSDDDCYLLVTANVEGVTKYFRSKPLPGRIMKAGYFYKWTTGNFAEPIELTATVAPWEDISGGTINTGD